MLGRALSLWFPWNPKFSVAKIYFSQELEWSALLHKYFIQNINIYGVLFIFTLDLTLLLGIIFLFAQYNILLSKIRRRKYDFWACQCSAIRDAIALYGFFLYKTRTDFSRCKNSLSYVRKLYQLNLCYVFAIIWGIQIKHDRCSNIKIFAICVVRIFTKKIEIVIIY